MNYKSIFNLAAITAITCLGLGCFGSMPRPGYFESMERKAGEGESEIVVKRLSRYVGGGGTMKILIDGQKRMKLWNGGIGTVIVPDGKYDVHAETPFWTGAPGNRSDIIPIDATSCRIVFEAKYTFLGTQLSKYMEIPFDGSNARPKSAISQSGQGLAKIAVCVTGKIPSDEKIAFGTGMLNSLVSSGRYTGIERSNSFLTETTQRSGAIDDSQISKLGRQFGAAFVCIADITPVGDGFQVSARIVDAATAATVFIGVSSFGRLDSKSGLSQVSDKAVESMFRGHPEPAR